MKATDFQFVSNLVRDRAAIVLEAGKEYLVESRLTPLARTLGFDSLEALIARVRLQTFGELSEAIIEAMTTNETSFFRDVHPFVAVREHILPELLRQRAQQKRLRIWCGAASSGQEPYTLAMLLRDSVPFERGWQVDFLSTDISRAMLTRCREGLYTQQEVNRGLPAGELVKSFRREGVQWRVVEELRRMVRFEQLNLVRPWLGLADVDLVFMRNVLIYFDVPTKKQVLAKVRTVMRPDGYLFLGTAETTYNIDDSFAREQYGKAVFYRKGTPQP